MNATLPVPIKPLSPREARFCYVFSHYPNASVAAQAAGYPAGSSKVAANKLLKRPAVRLKVAEIREEIATQATIGPSYVIANLCRIVEQQSATAPHHALRALDMLGRTLGMLSDRKEAPAPADVRFTLQIGQPAQADIPIPMIEDQIAPSSATPARLTALSPTGTEPGPPEAGVGGPGPKAPPLGSILGPHPDRVRGMNGDGNRNA